MVLVTVATSLASATPFIFKLIIDGVSLTTNKEAQLDALVFWGSVYVGTLALMWICWRLSGFVGLSWVASSIMTAYEDLYRHVTAHSHSYFSDRFAGSVANKISHAADGAGKVIENFMWGYYERILGLLISAGFMLYTNVWIGLVFLALIMVLIVINTPLVKYRRPYVVKYAEANSVLKGLGIDVLTNIAAVRQYALHSAKSANNVRIKDVRQARIAEWSLIINNTLIVIALGLITAIMISLFAEDQITTGDVVLVLTLIFSASESLVFIGNMMASVVRVFGEIEEGLNEVLIPYEIEDTQDAQELLVEKGEISWNNVNFEFGENKVFKDFELTIKDGERIGLVGPSGAGKTTFVSLLLRQHDITSGSIEIDGQNIAEVTQDSLRENIAVVPQEPALFHRTIRENIAYGKPDATDDEIEAVAKKAEAHDFIVTLPDGYDTLVGERGVKLSGGQRQRVAIARAMLKDAPILVLDEATSALDSESEVAIQKALHELMEGKTVVAIAHRLSTLREMDRIIVMNDGKIVEDGTHAALAAAGGIYASLWDHQAGGFLQE